MSVQKNIENFQNHLQDAVNAALEQTAQDLLDIAQESVPVVSGDLQDSAQVTIEDAKAIIAYTVDYAIQVHENPNSEGFKWFQNAKNSFDISGEFERNLKANLDI